MDVATDHPAREWSTTIRYRRCLDLKTGQVLIHRREPGHLVAVLAFGEVSVRKVRVDARGDRMRRARPGNTPAATLHRDYQRYRPCRWDLTCTVQAAETIHHQDLGFDIDVCAAHGAEHRRWVQENSGVMARNWTPEPAPGCECPDSHRDSGWSVAYCPTHGSPNRRGTELLAAELGLTPDPVADNAGLTTTSQAEAL